MRRTVFFNLRQIQLPVGALTSIAHRISGVLLACGIPLAMYVLQRSLRGPDSYAEVAAWFASYPVKAVSLILMWALAHHMLAGIRHLLSDVDVGSRLPAARRSAWTVNCLAIVIALLAAGVFL